MPSSLVDEIGALRMRDQVIHYLRRDVEQEYPGDLPYRMSCARLEQRGRGDVGAELKGQSAELFIDEPDADDAGWDVTLKLHWASTGEVCSVPPFIILRVLQNNSVTLRP